jgi:hypothetical protein
MKLRLIATALFVSLLISLIAATSERGVETQLLLDSALVDAQCRVAFETGLMYSFISGFSFTSQIVTPMIDTMNSDEVRLTEFADQGDARNYSIYIHEKFDAHLRQNVDALKAGMESLKNLTSQQPPEGETPQSGPPDQGGNGGAGGNGADGGGAPSDMQGLSPDEIKAAMETLQNEYKTLRETQEGCFDAQEHGKLVLDYYNTSIGRYEARANNLTERGVNASNLLKLIGDAKTQILPPLKNGINSASNSSQSRMILQQHCLYDGCTNGTNFHMAAKFEAMRVGDLLAAMSAKAKEKGLGSNLTAAQNELDAATKEIDSWGPKDASPEGLKKAWEGVITAAKSGHDIFIAINGTETE